MQNQKRISFFMLLMILFVYYDMLVYKSTSVILNIDIYANSSGNNYTWY